MLVRVDVLVSSYKREKRTFEDRQTGQKREYISCQLAGITTDLTTPCLLRVPEAISNCSEFDPDTGIVKPGRCIQVALASFESGMILEGKVAEVAPIETPTIKVPTGVLVDG